MRNGRSIVQSGGSGMGELGTTRTSPARSPVRWKLLIAGERGPSGGLVHGNPGGCRPARSVLLPPPRNPRRRYYVRQRSRGAWR